MLKKTFATMGVIVGVVLLLFLFSGDNLHLDVTTQSRLLSIKNVGSEPTIIEDIVINDRYDCSAYPNYGKMHYSDGELHKLWVNGTDQNIDINDPPETTSAEAQKLTLNVGDIHHWLVPCTSVIRAKITTDKGSATYAFSSE